MSELVFLVKKVNKLQSLLILQLLNSDSSRGCCWFTGPGFILASQNLFIGHSTKISAFTLLSFGLQNQVTGLAKHYSRVTQSVSYACFASSGVVCISIECLNVLF